MYNPHLTVSTISTILRDTRPCSLRLALFRPDIPTVRYLMEHSGDEFRSISALEIHLNVENSSFDMPLFLVSLQFK